ncbi:MAG: zinc ribbon domain-containing protein [Methanobacteriota archaeon]|nr:MAG: zinc ribbon domain-containing protein [Euryarchaeota archaeon]
MKCRNCASENPDGTKLCGNCGKELEEAPVAVGGESARKCSSCGRTLEMEASVCPFCGHWVKRSLFG